MKDMSEVQIKKKKLLCIVYLQNYDLLKSYVLFLHILLLNLLASFMNRYI